MATKYFRSRFVELPSEKQIAGLCYFAVVVQSGLLGIVVKTGWLDFLVFLLIAGILSAFCYAVLLSFGSDAKEQTTLGEYEQDLPIIEEPDANSLNDLQYTLFPLENRKELYDAIFRICTLKKTGEGVWQKEFGWTAKQYRDFTDELAGFGIVEKRKGANPVIVLTFEQALAKYAECAKDEYKIDNFWGPILEKERPQYSGTIPYRDYGVQKEML